MTTRPTTVKAYLDALPPDRREMIDALRKVIRANLDKGYEETIQYGMIGYCVPHSVYPAGYHCDPKQPLPYVSIASQKNHVGIYLFCVYSSEELQDWFREAWASTGKRLDMGKSCVRVKKLEDIPLDVIGRTIKKTPTKKFIAHYESAFGERRRPASKKKVTKKKVTKKASRR